MTQFKKAERSRVFLKLGVTGASGSGKTFSALRLASGLADGGRIAMIDTENRSASLYADRFDFDVLDLEPPYDHDKFVSAINAAVGGGYAVVVLDSASHFWEGILEFKSKLDARGGNSYTNWSKAGEHFKEIVNAVLQSQIHVIACLRSKMDYVIEQSDRGKATPRKVGLAPIMRDGVEYEFTTVFDIDMAHQAATSKDRTGLFGDKVFQITEDTGKQILSWLGSAKGPAVVHGVSTPALTPVTQACGPEIAMKIREGWTWLNTPTAKRDAAIQGAGVDTLEQVPLEVAEKWLHAIQERMSA